MTADVVKVDIDAPLSEVKDIFDVFSFHHLLVVDKGTLVGVLSDRDYFKSTSPKLGTPIETIKDSSTLNIKVHRIMSRNLVTIKETDSIFDAVYSFHKSKKTCLPVVDENFRPVGIISWKDIVDQLAENMIEKRKNKKEE